MKFIFAVLTVLSLASCVGNTGPTRLVLSEPNDSASVHTLTHRHELQITENRILLYNGEEKSLRPLQVCTRIWFLRIGLDTFPW